MKKLKVTFVLLTAFFLISVNYVNPAAAFNDPPFDFLFGNHIDTHQQTRLLKNGNLRGFFYIIFTGDIDSGSGLPIARHPRGAGEPHYEGCDVDEIDCVVGWMMNGQPGEAKFLFHEGIYGDDHPVWLVNRVDIPQPGSYTHFHWIADNDDAPTQTTDARVREIPTVCNQQNAGLLESAGAANEICPGWFLQIRAVRSFAFRHGGEIIPIYPGMDNASHLNLVTNYAVVPEIDSIPVRPLGKKSTSRKGRGVDPSAFSFHGLFGYNRLNSMGSDEHSPATIMCIPKNSTDSGTHEYQTYCDFLIGD